MANWHAAMKGLRLRPCPRISVAVVLTLLSLLYLRQRYLAYKADLECEVRIGASRVSPLKKVDYSRAAGVHCSELFTGNKAAVSKAKAFVAACAPALKRQADAEDSSLADMSCQDLLSAGYARSPASLVEAEFPLAFGLRLHQRPAQAELLLRSIYAPQNVYCVHIDPAASAVVFGAMRRIASCLPNVHIVTPAEPTFVYASVSPLLADLACMRLLLAARDTRWRYFINLTGQELPLRTNYELVRLLTIYNGSNEIESAVATHFNERYAGSYWCKNHVPGGPSVKCPLPHRPKSPPPGNVTIYKGIAYGLFSRALVEYVLTEGGFGVKLLGWFNDTYSPDENYWATLQRLHYVPGSYSGQQPLLSSARAVLWDGKGHCSGMFVRTICIFGAGDLPWLLSRHHAFANKFQVDYDPIAPQCLAKRIMEQAASESHEPGHIPWYWDTYLQMLKLFRAGL